MSFVNLKVGDEVGVMSYGTASVKTVSAATATTVTAEGETFMRSTGSLRGSKGRHCHLLEVDTAKRTIAYRALMSEFNRSKEALQSHARSLSVDSPDDVDAMRKLLDDITDISKRFAAL